MIIKNAMTFLDHGEFIKKDIYIKDQRITDAFEEDTTVIDADGLYAIPGLTDLHLHGSVGYDFCDGTHEAIEAIAIYQANQGVTSIAPATMTLGDDVLSKVFESAATYVSERGASLVGIHMEGPYLSCAKKGAQNAKYLRKPDLEHFHKMNELSGGKIKLVSIAPEEDDSLEFIKKAHNEVVLSVAHTTADYDTAMAAFENGASHVTHLYNAMLPFTHREPGVVGAAFDSKHSKVELICDGVHIAPPVVRATFQMFGDDRIVLVSDGMMATGMEDGQYTLGGQDVTVRGNKATLADGTIAGSVTNLMKCMQTAISFGIPLGSAVKCAAVNPAKQLGIYEEYGSIDSGKYANIVLLDQNFEVRSIILRGQQIK